MYFLRRYLDHFHQFEIDASETSVPVETSFQLNLDGSSVTDPLEICGYCVNFEGEERSNPSNLATGEQL